MVVTPAVPQDSELYIYLKKSGVSMLKRSQVLGMLSEEYFTVLLPEHTENHHHSNYSTCFTGGWLAFNAFIGGFQ